VGAPAINSPTLCLCVDSGGDFTSRLLRPAAAAVTTAAVEVSHALNSLNTPNPISMFVVRANYRATPRDVPRQRAGRRPRNKRSSLTRRIRRADGGISNICAGMSPTATNIACACCRCSAMCCALFVFRPIRAFALRVLFLYIYCLLIRVLYKLHLVPVDLTGKQAK
jgi:hypothetical protein